MKDHDEEKEVRKKIIWCGAIALTIIVILVSLISCVKPPDSPLEELAEEVIEEATGIPLDLTPNSPEYVENLR